MTDLGEVLQRLSTIEANLLHLDEKLDKQIIERQDKLEVRVAANERWRLLTTGGIMLLVALVGWGAIQIFTAVPAKGSTHGQLSSQ